MATIPITKRGAEKLKDELHRLKTVERPSIIQAIAEARAQGDLSENAEYEAAKDRQGFIEGRIAEVESKLSAAQIIDPSSVDAGGRVVGLLLRADMAPLDLLPEPGAIKDAIALARRPVNEVMISPIPTVATTTDLRRVAGVLLETGLPGLPVTDEQGLLAGFISRTDILRAVASDPPLDLWS